MKDAESVPKHYEGLKSQTIALTKKEGWEARIRIKGTELMIFTRQFATMVDAGVPLEQALETLSQATENEKLKLLLREVQRRVTGGTKLSEAMEKFTKTFTEMYVSMIVVAEVTGDLPGILLELAEFMESKIRMKSKVIAAMTYPVISLVMVGGIGAALVLVVVPKFEDLFTMMKSDLPLPTKILLNFSRFILGNMMLSLFLLCGSVFAGWRLMKLERVRYAVDVVRLKIPVFGTLAKQIVVSRFAKTFGTLLRCGVPVLKSLEIVQKAIGSAVLGRAIGECIGAVGAGKRLAEVLQEKPVMPLMVVKMIEVGEKTGQLEALLEKVAKFYEERVGATIEGLTALIEPLLILVLGTLVGGAVFAIFLPIIKMSQAIK